MLWNNHMSYCKEKVKVENKLDVICSRDYFKDLKESQTWDDQCTM
jgi:hypothetical protein